MRRLVLCFLVAFVPAGAGETAPVFFREPDKATAKRIVRDHGLPTPDFALVECEADVAGVTLPLPLFAKPVAEGTSKGVGATSIIRRRRDLARVCRELLETYRAPVLVETFLLTKTASGWKISGIHWSSRSAG